MYIQVNFVSYLKRPNFRAIVVVGTSPLFMLIDIQVTIPSVWCWIIHIPHGAPLTVCWVNIEWSFLSVSVITLRIMITVSSCPCKLSAFLVQVMQLIFLASGQYSPFRLDVEHELYHHPPLILSAQLPEYPSLSLSIVENGIFLAWNWTKVPPSASTNQNKQQESC